MKETELDLLLRGVEEIIPRSGFLKIIKVSE